MNQKWINRVLFLLGVVLVLYGVRYLPIPIAMIIMGSLIVLKTSW